MNRQRRYILTGLFALYLLALFRITVFRSDFLNHGFCSGSILWIPFVELTRILRNDFFVFFYLLVGNIIWFIPFGFLVPMLYRTGKKTIVYSLGLSMMIETLQFIFGSGVTEVEDLILNTLGGAMGYWCYLAGKTLMAARKTSSDPK